MLKDLGRTAALAVGLIGTQLSHAGLVTPDVIFGAGNANGGFTIIEDQGLELGLRAKLRYNMSGNAENTFPWDGTDTYTFLETDGVAPAGRAIWSFEWAINTDSDPGNASGNKITDFVYTIDITGPGGYSFSYDPLGLLQGVSFGTNSTANGAGTDAFSFDPGTGKQWFTSTTTTIDLLNFNVAQTSENIGFTEFNNNDPQAVGQYRVSLTATAQDKSLSNTIFIDVQAVSAPATLALFGFGIAGLGFSRRKKLRQP